MRRGTRVVKWPSLALRDTEPLGDARQISVAVLALLAAGVIGAIIAVLVASPQSLRSATAQSAATRAPLLMALPSATATATTTPTSTPRPRPTATPVPATPQPSPTPTAAQVWAGLQPDLEAAWGTDTPRTVALLRDFLARFADYGPAREKLYAALIASAAEQTKLGEVDAAQARLQQARELMPDRGEAAATQTALTPTPNPPADDDPPDAVSNAPVLVQAARPPAPAPAVRQPAPASRPVVAVVPPTPTKQPFRPPGGRDS